MIGLDTNVLVRYLTGDDPAQSAAAGELIENRLTPEQPGFVSAVVIAELAWVLKANYRLSEGDVAAAMRSLIQAEVFQIEHESELFAAVCAVEDGAAAFADALIGAIARSAGCDYTLTFDRRAVRSPAFRLV